MLGNHGTLFGTGALPFKTRRPASEADAEFDITAMVDLVFMMNIYFLVTFVTAVLAELDLPTASHVAPVDASQAVVITLVNRGFEQPVEVILSERSEDLRISDPSEQAQRIQDLVAEASDGGKTDVLIKAEKSVRLGEVFRIATAAHSDGMKLHTAVLETDGAE